MPESFHTQFENSLGENDIHIQRKDLDELKYKGEIDTAMK